MLRVLTRAAFALASAIVVVGCAQPSRSTKDIASIVITGDICASCSKSLVVRGDGRIEDLSAGNEATVTDRGVAASTIASFPIAAFSDAAKGLPTIITPANLAIVIVLFHDGSFARAAVPVGNPAYDGVAALQQWTSSVDTALTAKLFEQRWAAIDDALAKRTMRTVVLESVSTFGRCPTYTAIFHRSDMVTVHQSGAGCTPTMNVRGRFARVLEAISDAGGSRMHAYYPVLASNTGAARITLVTASGTFVSTGPDRSSWGSEFLATESRLDQIVRDVRSSRAGANAGPAPDAARAKQDADSPPQAQTEPTVQAEPSVQPSPATVRDSPTPAAEPTAQPVPIVQAVPTVRAAKPKPKHANAQNFSPLGKFDP